MKYIKTEGLRSDSLFSFKDDYMKIAKKGKKIKKSMKEEDEGREMGKGKKKGFYGAKKKGKGKGK
jgi:hypothetical protein